MSQQQQERQNEIAMSYLSPKQLDWLLVEPYDRVHQLDEALHYIGQHLDHTSRDEKRSRVLGLGNEFRSFIDLVHKMPSTNFHYKVFGILVFMVCSSQSLLGLPKKDIEFMSEFKEKIGFWTMGRDPNNRILVRATPDMHIVNFTQNKMNEYRRVWQCVGGADENVPPGHTQLH